MSELVDFLTARLDEDELAARMASRVMETGDRWEVLRQATYDEVNVAGPSMGYRVADVHRGAAHVARHDPARVLREVTAKRAILAKYQRAQAAYEQMVNPASTAAVFALAEVVQHMAAAWEDRPDFQEQWR